MIPFTLYAANSTKAVSQIVKASAIGIMVSNSVALQCFSKRKEEA